MKADAAKWIRRIRSYLARALAEGDFDMVDVSGDQAAAVVEECARIEKLVAAVKLKAAARVAETEAWKGGTDVDAAAWLARMSGSTKRDAKRSLDAAKRLEGQERTKRAAEQGELSEGQLREVSEAAEANPAAEQELLESARQDSFPELKDKANKAKASAGDRRTRHQRIKRERYLRSGIDGEGAFWMNYRNTADVGAEIMAALRPIQDRLMKDARTRTCPGRATRPGPPTPWPKRCAARTPPPPGGPGPPGTSR